MSSLPAGLVGSLELGDGGITLQVTRAMTDEEAVLVERVVRHVNIADEMDAPIGLVNIIRKGYCRFAVWGSDLTAVNAGFKMGGSHLYTLLGVGMARPHDNAVRYAFNFGLGWHQPAGDFFVDTELLGSTFYFRPFTSENHILASLRVVGGWQIAPRFALTAGLTLNVLTAWNGTDIDLALGPQYVYQSGQTTVRVFPGLTFGLQI